MRGSSSAVALTVAGMSSAAILTVHSEWVRPRFTGVCISAESPDVAAEEIDAYNRAHPDTRVIRCMIPQRYTTGIASTYYLN